MTTLVLLIAKARHFLNNPSYATWAQTIFVLLGVLVAFYAAKDADKNQAIANSFLFVQKFYLDTPSASNASLDLRKNQFDIVQIARKSITDYDPSQDNHMVQLFKQAEPLVLSSIEKDEHLKQLVEQVDHFFSPLLTCISQDACDKDTAVRLLKVEILSFWNATCPYFAQQGRTYRNKEDVDRYMYFLVEMAGVKKSDDYFCKDMLQTYNEDKNKR